MPKNTQWKYQDILEEMYGKDVLETELVPFQGDSELKTLKFKYESWITLRRYLKLKMSYFRCL